MIAGYVHPVMRWGVQIWMILAFRLKCLPRVFTMIIFHPWSDTYTDGCTMILWGIKPMWLCAPAVTKLYIYPLCKYLGLLYDQQGVWWSMFQNLSQCERGLGPNFCEVLNQRSLLPPWPDSMWCFVWRHCRYVLLEVFQWCRNMGYR